LEVKRKERELNPLRKEEGKIDQKDRTIYIVLIGSEGDGREIGCVKIGGDRLPIAASFLRYQVRG